MTKIMDNAVATAAQMAAYLLSVNPYPKIEMPVVQFCQLYLDMAAKEGVRGDALFAQSCHETGNFKFPGTVTPDQNNYSGLGTLNATTKGAYFACEADGILAQAQHAKAYATKDPLCEACIDPRYDLLIRYGKAGTAEHWEDLGGKWAVPGYATGTYSSLEEANAAGDSYGYKIIKDMKPFVEISESTLYPILRRLEGANMLSVWTAEHNGRLRKYYRITQLGRKRIQDFKEEWKEMLSIYQFVTKEDA